MVVEEEEEVGGRTWEIDGAGDVFRGCDGRVVVRHRDCGASGARCRQCMRVVEDVCRGDVAGRVSRATCRALSHARVRIQIPQ